MDTISKIRRDYYVHGKSLRRMARERKLSRNTVRKVIRENKTKFTYQRAIQPRRKMGDYVEQLNRLLSDNLELPRKRRLTLKQMYEALCESGFEGSYETVCHHARKWRHEHACSQSDAFIPQQFAPGEAYQFDWSEEFVRIGAAPRKLRLAQMKLCYSRQPFVRAYPRETQEMVFDAHNRAFAWYGGSCECGIYDNMSTAVTKVKSEQKRLYNRRFEQMCSHFLMKPQA